MIALRQRFGELLHSRWFFFLKVGVSCVLITLILVQCNWGLTWQTIRKANLFFLVLVFVCMVGGVVISAVKWQVLLSIHGAHAPLSTLNRYYFIAVFFNNFLPSSIGGDGYRIYKTAADCGAKTPAVLAVLVERISGLWALLALGFIGGLFSGPLSSRLPFFQLIMWFLGSGLVLSGIVFLVLFIASGRLAERGYSPGRLLTPFGWILDYRRHPWKTIQVILLSFTFQLYVLLWMLLLSRAVGGHISIFQLAVAVMISNIAAMIPISLNGLGLMDGSFIYIAGLLGMRYEHGVMMMIVIRVFMVFLSLIGAVFYLRIKRKGSVAS